MTSQWFTRFSAMRYIVSISLTSTGQRFLSAAESARIVFRKIRLARIWNALCCYNQSRNHIDAVSSPVHQNEMSSYIVETRGTKYNYILLFWRTSQIFYYYSTYAQILLLSHKMLKYYYYHTICSNTTILIAQREKSTKMDVGARGGAGGGQLYVRVRDFGEWNLTFNLRKWWISESYMYKYI